MRARKILFICWFDPNKYSMIVQHINNIRDRSKNHIDVLNLFNNVITRGKLFFHRFLRSLHNTNLKNDTIDITSYDGYIIHNTISYDIKNVIAINSRFSPSLQDFTGFKVLMKQDESLNTNLTFFLLNEWRFDLFLTCIPQEQWDIHFKTKVPSSLMVMSVLTGYVDDKMKQFTFSQESHRPIDIFYRGMLLPYFFGKLSHEKYLIGEKFKQISADHNLISDISSNIEDRLHGENWIKALANSKATLAVESGASIFDWDGSLQEKEEIYRKENPDVTFDEFWEKFLKKFEEQVNYAQISPRHLEAAATKTVQIMFEGNYNGIFLKDLHYLSLKRDFTNLDEVIFKLHNKDLRKKITDQAFKDIILNKKYSYSSFVMELDKNISMI